MVVGSRNPRKPAVMDWQSIKTEQGYDTLREWIDKPFNRKTPFNRPEDLLVRTALLFINDYKDKQHIVAD